MQSAVQPFSDSESFLQFSTRLRATVLTKSVIDWQNKFQQT